jgi:hypothetical protein
VEGEADQFQVVTALSVSGLLTGIFQWAEQKRCDADDHKSEQQSDHIATNLKPARSHSGFDIRH